jgi:hypothetical protein
MRTLVVALCATLVFAAAAAAAGTARSRSSGIDQVTLTVSKGGTGTGSVTSDPAGIACGTTCSGQFPAGTAVILKAEPSADSNGGYSTFGGYSENCKPWAPPGVGEPDKIPRPDPLCKVVLSGDTSVQATFTYFPPCVVPGVKGMTLYYAKRRLWSAHCRVGFIVRVFSRKVRRGRVTDQLTPPGSHREPGWGIDLVVSKGKRHAR